MTRAGGFTLVSAIFLMVVLAILAVSLVTLSAVQHATSAQQLQTVRANYAARFGAEWAIHVANQVGGCPAGPTTLTPAGALDGFTVTVSCSRTAHTSGTTTEGYYVVNVSAESGTYGSVDYVRRRAQLKVKGK